MTRGGRGAMLCGALVNGERLMPRAAWKLVARGELLAEQGDLKSARRAFEDAAAAAPRDHRVLLCHAAAVAGVQPGEAPRLARQAADLARGSAAASALAAKYALFAGEHRAAEELADRALATEKGSGLARTVRSLATLPSSDPERGVAGLVEHGIFEESRVAGMAALLLLRRWQALGPVAPPIPHGLKLPAPGGGATERARTPLAGRRALHRAYSQSDGAAMLLALRCIAPTDADYDTGYATALHLCGRDDLADPWVRAALAGQRAQRTRQHSRRRGKATGLPADDLWASEPETLVLAAWIALGLGDAKRARKYAARGSRTANPFDRWDARMALAAAADAGGDPAVALAELTLAVSEEPTVLRLLLHKAALHPVLLALRAAVEAAQTAGGGPVAKALRHEMLRILTDPRAPGRRRALQRLLQEGCNSIGDAEANVLRPYAQRGLRCVVGGNG